MSLLVAFAWPPDQASAGNPYVISEFPVEAVDKDAVAAKRRAMADGQAAAFRSLLKRIVPVTAYARIPKLDEKTIQDLTEGLSIRSERNSRTEYIATLDYSFRQRAVQDVLRSYGVPFVDRQGPEVALLPLFLDQAGQIAADQTARWVATWRGLDLVNAIQPMAIVNQSAAIRPDVLQAAVRGEEQALGIIKGELGRTALLIAHASIDPNTKKLAFGLSGTDAVGTFAISRSFSIYYGDFDYTAELAAVVLQGIVDGRWKAANAVASAGAGTASVSPGGVSAGGEAATVTAFVEFSGLGEWQRILARLRATPGITSLQTGALSARGAEVSIAYPGGAGPLADQLARQGIALADTGNGYVMRAN